MYAEYAIGTLMNCIVFSFPAGVGVGIFKGIVWIHSWTFYSFVKSLLVTLPNAPFNTNGYVGMWALFLWNSYQRSGES